MNNSEAIAITGNVIHINEVLNHDPKEAVNLVRQMLLNDPIALMRFWVSQGNSLPHQNILTTVSLLSLQELRADSDKMRRVKEYWPWGNQKVEAIKLVRTWTNCGLKEAKDFVEAI